MKKLISLLATVYLVVLMAVPSFADESHSGRVPALRPGPGTVITDAGTILTLLKVFGIVKAI